MIESNERAFFEAARAADNKVEDRSAWEEAATVERNLRADSAGPDDRQQTSSAIRYRIVVRLFKWVIMEISVTN